MKSCERGVGRGGDRRPLLTSFRLTLTLDCARISTHLIQRGRPAEPRQHCEGTRLGEEYLQALQAVRWDARHSPSCPKPVITIFLFLFIHLVSYFFVTTEASRPRHAEQCPAALNYMHTGSSLSALST